MARNDGRIEKGQPLRTAISARAWNRAQEAADRVLGAQPGTAGEGAKLAQCAPNIILVKNSGTPVPWLGVIAIGSPINNPSGTTLNGTAPEGRSFVSQPVMSGNVPSNPDAMCGIAMEPIAANAIGRVAVSGVIPCKMKILSLYHGYARARVGDSTQLVSCECGPYRILWKESPGNDKFALVTA